MCIIIPYLKILSHDNHMTVALILCGQTKPIANSYFCMQLSCQFYKLTYNGVVKISLHISA